MSLSSEAKLLCLLVTPAVLLVALAVLGMITHTNIDTFLFCVEAKPSTIHGKGLFATCPIKAGVYTMNMHTSQMFEKAQGLLDVVDYSNSGLVPPFLEMMGVNESDRVNESTAPMATKTPSLEDRVSRFKVKFDRWKEEERWAASFSFDLSNLAIIVHDEINVGDELLRDYGEEWILLLHDYYEDSYNTKWPQMPEGWTSAPEAFIKALAKEYRREDLGFDWLWTKRRSEVAPKWFENNEYDF